MELHEDVAWAVATAWQRELCGRVWLALDPTAARSFDIVKCYEWIHVDLTRHHGDTEATQLQLVACLRAACTLWTALARCGGYSGAENPAFWRCVFRSFDSQPDSRNAPSADAFGFFDRGPERTFPRVLLSVDGEAKVQDVERIVRVFGGLESYADGEPERTSLLDAMLSQLPPLCCLSGKNKPPQMALAIQVPSPRNAAQLVERIEAVTTSPECTVFFEKLVVSEWSWQGDASATLDNLGALQNIPRISIPTLTMPPLGGYENYHPHLQTIFGLGSASQSSPDRHTSQFLLARAQLENDELYAVLSALPHTRHIDTVRFDLPCRLDHNFTSFDWAWLGYAVFHPDAATSSWRRLALETVHIGDAQVENFTRMARGNNLLAALPRDWGSYPRTSDAYHTATLSQETPVFESGPEVSERVLSHLPAHSAVDVCVASCDVTTFPDFVCVVVPGLGIGWIDKRAIADVTARPATAPGETLSEFQLSSRFVEPRLSNALVDVLCVLGPSLQHLGIRAIEWMGARVDGYVAAHPLMYMLRKCPKLTSLAVPHDGSLWSKRHVMARRVIAAMPRLTHLELSCGREHAEYMEPSQVSLDTVFSDLQALRVISPGKKPGNASAVGSLLANHEGLRYFHWQQQVFKWRTSPSDDRVDQTTPNVLENMLLQLEGVSMERLTHGRGPLPVRQRAAFLSVIEKANEEPQGEDSAAIPSALAALDRDILERVFPFASMPVERLLCFDGEFP